MKTLSNAELQAKLKTIRYLILDVDGVMTDGGIIIDDAGLESKRFDVRDGHGLKMLIRNGIEVLLLTGRTSKVVETRARELGIADVYQGAKDKRAVYEKLLQERQIQPEEVAFVGDDVVDVPVLRRVGFSATVADSAEDVKSIVDYITNKQGGRGAVREICELILKATGKWEAEALRYELL